MAPGQSNNKLTSPDSALIWRGLTRDLTFPGLNVLTNIYKRVQVTNTPKCKQRGYRPAHMCVTVSELEEQWTQNNQGQ